MRCCSPGDGTCVQPDEGVPRPGCLRGAPVAVEVTQLLARMRWNRGRRRLRHCSLLHD